MTTIPLKQISADGIVRQNIVTVRLLALCPMLAVSVSAEAALTLGLLTLSVMTAAGFCVALLRAITPDAVRLPIFLIIVATLVAIADISTAALSTAIHQKLGIFLPLIITNCAVLARLEVFAAKQPPLAATVDGFMMGCGMTAVLLSLAIVREFLGTGQIGNFPALPLFDGIPSALLPVGGFFLFAGLLAVFRLVQRGDIQS